MNPFVYQQFPVRIRFGEGSVRQLSEEAALAGMRRALVLCTPEQKAQAQMAAELLGDRFDAIFDGAQMHVPSSVVADAAALARRRGNDGIVAIGGGSTLGLAKALALEEGHQIIAVPTTYAGSEMTTIYGITTEGRKKTGRDQRVLPKTVIYDPVLTESLPREMSVTSGLNAVAHAVEALYAPDTNPIVGLMAQEAIRAMTTGLKGLGTSPTARSDCLYAAWLAGAALGTTTMGLHHRICHVLGGKLNLPHAAMHSVVLPYVLRYNAAHIASTLDRISIAMGLGIGADVPRELRNLGTSLGIPTSLSAIGMGPERIDEITGELLESGAYVNPAPLQRPGVQKLLLDALHGDW